MAVVYAASRLFIGLSSLAQRLRVSQASLLWGDAALELLVSALGG